MNILIVDDHSGYLESLKTIVNYAFEDAKNLEITKSLSCENAIQTLKHHVAINKTFCASIMGDVGGANIDIASKELGKDSVIDISFSNGVNNQTVNENFKLIDGTNWFGTQRTNHPIRSLTNYDFQNNLLINKY